MKTRISWKIVWVHDYLCKGSWYHHNVTVKQRCLNYYVLLLSVLVWVCSQCENCPIEGSSTVIIEVAKLHQHENNHLPTRILAQGQSVRLWSEKLKFESSFGQLFFGVVLHILQMKTRISWKIYEFTIIYANIYHHNVTVKQRCLNYYVLLLSVLDWVCLQCEKCPTALQ